MTRFLALLGVFPAAGALAMVLSWLRTRRAEPELRRAGTPTIGTVIDNQGVTTATGETVYRPVVRFTTDRGRPVRAVGDTVARRAFPIDSTIAVVYDPARPQDIVTGPGRPRTYLVGGIVFAVIAVILFGVALALR